VVIGQRDADEVETMEGLELIILTSSSMLTEEASNSIIYQFPGYLRAGYGKHPNILLFSKKGEKTEAGKVNNRKQNNEV